MSNSRKADLLVALSILALLLVGCGPISLPPFGGRACQIGSTADTDCACYVYVAGSGWHYRDCPPSPSPTPIPTPTPTPTPTPVPTPSPSPTAVTTPQPTPTPCVPTVEPFKCPAGTPECWRCSDRLEWDVARGNLTPLPGSTLLYNDPGNDPSRREYIDRECRLVRRDGSVIRTAEQQFGTACVDGQAVCPPDRLSPCPSPTPSTSPTPGPTPTPGTCPACPAIAAIVGKVHQYQWQHQTVPNHQEGDTWVAKGPVDKVNWDSTVYYGCAAPRCDSEHNQCLAKCEDLRGPRYRVVSGPLSNCQAENPGDDGRGFALNCDMTEPFGEVSVEVCTVSPWISTETGEHISGQACKTLHGRVDH